MRWTDNEVYTLVDDVCALEEDSPVIPWKEPGGLSVAYTSGRRIVAMKPRHAMTISVLLIGLAIYAGGCVTPVIPLPPPDTDNMMLADNSCDTTNKTIRFQGLPSVTQSGMYVFILNELSAKGTILLANGQGGFSEVKDFPAEDGQKLLIWVKATPYEENKSDTVAVTLDCGKTKEKKNGFVKSF